MDNTLPNYAYSQNDSGRGLLICYIDKIALSYSLRQNQPQDQNKQGQYMCLAAQLHFCQELVPAQCSNQATDMSAAELKDVCSLTSGFGCTYNSVKLGSDYLVQVLTNMFVKTPLTPTT